MSKGTNLFRYIAKSKFMRSVFLRVLSIFIIVSIAIAGVVFVSFATEIRKNILTDRQKQLAAVEETISKRMEEITSIAYNIGADSTFYLEPVEGAAFSGYEMSHTLARYLVGNSFIEHLAYYRLSEPDKIYISSGERSLSEFFSTSFGMDKAAAEETIRGIRSVTKTDLRLIRCGKDKTSYFAYLYPLPQLSAHPQAFVMMLIPLQEVEPLLETLMMNSSGEVAVFNAEGSEIYRTGELDEDIPLDAYVRSGAAEEAYRSDAGRRYILQKQVSATNGWIYVSVIRQSDTLSGLANRQLMFIILLLLLMLLAVLAMLAGIVTQYKPISHLAEAVAERAPDGGDDGAVIDESVLLSHTIATLQDDSEQKQRYELAYHEAEAASRAKSTFLSNMSHDIRTPMNAVIGMTAIALRHADEPETVRECLGKVQLSSQYLLDIINNVLDMSRIESGRFTLAEEVIDLSGLINALVTLLEPSVEAKGQRLEAEVGEIDQRWVLGDNVRLTQVFVNILSNAVKFTPEGGTIRLSMRQTQTLETGRGRYVFVFSDTGIGIPPEFIDRVFDTFSRADGMAVSRVDGTGLGMAIAKNLVEMMGGTISCQSKLGEGTTFTVVLDMKPAERESAPGGDAARRPQALSDQDEPAPRLDGRRILLVEDNAINREIAVQILGETGAEVVQACNGQEAVEAFRGSPEGAFDLVLMDVQMPVMNGYEATRALRALARGDAATTPIYAMTANTFDEDVRRVKEAGMNGHIGKPYTPAALYRLLREVLGG